MMPRNALTRLGKIVAKAMAGEQSDGEALEDVGEMLASDPEDILEVLELMARESQKKRPNKALLDAFGFMIGQALEIMRFGSEQNHPEAFNIIKAIRERILSLVQERKLNTETLHLILRQFVSAKLDLGSELQELMVSSMEDETILPNQTDMGDMFADMAQQWGDDIFALQAELAEQTSTLPEDYRSGIVAALLNSEEYALRETTVGWLLDAGATTRRDTLALLQQAAMEGNISGSMLRRMIEIRNWLPEQERSLLDAVIRICRQNNIDCAVLSPSEVRDVIVTGIDGSGAQSLFILCKDGRRQVLTSVLVKFGVGVRDTWIQPALTKAKVGALLSQIQSQTECHKSTLDHVYLLLAYALSMPEKSGVLPPFGLVDVIEKAGLTSVNPQPLSAADLIARLMDEVAESPMPTVDEALAKSSQWMSAFPVFESWFEDDGTLAVLLTGKRTSIKRRVASVLEKYLPARRTRWAELLAWMSVTLLQDPATKEDGLASLLVARELLGDRSLVEIPLMVFIAERTVTMWKSRQS